MGENNSGVIGKSRVTFFLKLRKLKNLKSTRVHEEQREVIEIMSALAYQLMLNALNILEFKNSSHQLQEISTYYGEGRNKDLLGKKNKSCS